MKKSKQILTVLLLMMLVLSVLCVPAFALTESEVETQVASAGKEAVTGNVLIWFLCAVAFLKVSQKIDSFMATLGVNVGRTGGSMLAEAMIAMRAVTMVVGGGHGGGAGRAGSAAGSSAAAKSRSQSMKLTGMPHHSSLSPFCLIVILMGVPSSPNTVRIWFSKYRW